MIIFFTIDCFITLLGNMHMLVSTSLIADIIHEETTPSNDGSLFWSYSGSRHYVNPKSDSSHNCLSAPFVKYIASTLSMKRLCGEDYI